MQFLCSRLWCRDLGLNDPNNQRLKNNVGTFPLQDQQWHLCDWQDQVGPHKYRYMLAGVELEKYASGHQMSNQQ